MNKSLIAIAVASLVSTPSLSFAQDSNVETVVVLGKSENVNSIADIPANIQIIDKEEIERSGAQSLDTLLRSRAGIQVSDTNSGPVFSLRGFTGSQAAHNTLILVDGRKLNKSDLSAPQLNSILISQVESVEILSGSAGVLYGDQAVGGVINIITTNSSSESTEVSVSAGSFDSFAGSVSSSGSITENWNYLVSASQDDSDNFRENNARETGTVLGRLDYSKDDKRFYSELSYFDNNREYAGSLTEDQFNEDPSQANGFNSDDHRHEITRAARAGYRRNIADNWAMNLDVSFDDTSAVGLFYSSPFDTNNSTLFGAVKAEGRIGEKLNLLIGLETSRNDYDYKSSFIDRENEQLVTSLYSQFNYSITDEVSTILGGRYSKVNDQITDVNTSPSGVDLDEDATAIEAGLNIRPSANNRYYVRAESNFRFAKVDEQAYTSPDVTGLKPQTGYSIEAGWDHFGGDYSVKVDAYSLRLKDEIVFDSSAEKPIGGSSQGANVNADKSERIGFSLYADKYLTDSVLIGAEYNYVDAEFTDGENSGKALSWVAKNTGRAFSTIDITQNWQFFVEGTYVGERFKDGDNGNTQDKLPEYWLGNAAINYYLDAWSASLRVDNMFDKKFAANANIWGSYYPGDGRKVMATASYNF